MPTKQDLGSSQGFFSKFLASSPALFIWDPPTGTQSPVTIPLSLTFFSDCQTARAKAAPSVGNYLVDIKSFEQLALPTIKLNLDRSKVTENSKFYIFLVIM